MKRTALMHSALFLSALLPLSFVCAPTVNAAQAPAKNAQSAAPGTNGNTASAGQAKGAGAAKSAKDPLAVCLSRIPDDSSRGQRQLAEEGCRKEQQVRASRHAAPEF